MTLQMIQRYSAYKNRTRRTPVLERAALEKIFKNNRTGARSARFFFKNNRTGARRAYYSK